MMDPMLLGSMSTDSKHVDIDSCHCLWSTSRPRPLTAGKHGTAKASYPATDRTTVASADGVSSDAAAEVASSHYVIDDVSAWHLGVNTNFLHEHGTHATNYTNKDGFLDIYIYT